MFVDQIKINVKAGKGGDGAVADLVGKTIGIVAKQQSDDYGDKLVVSKYREGTLKAAENIPF